MFSFKRKVFVFGVIGVMALALLLYLTFVDTSAPPDAVVDKADVLSDRPAPESLAVPPAPPSPLEPVRDASEHIDAGVDVHPSIVQFHDTKPGHMSAVRARRWAEDLKTAGEVDHESLRALITSGDTESQLLGVYLWLDLFGYEEELAEAILDNPVPVWPMAELAQQLYRRHAFDEWEDFLLKALEYLSAETFETWLRKEAAASLMMGVVDPDHPFNERLADAIPFIIERGLPDYEEPDMEAII